MVGSKTLGEKQSFSRWQKRVMQLYKVFKKGLAGENTCFFFNASSSLFLEALNQRWSSQMCCFSDLANCSLKELDWMGWMCDIVMAWLSIEKYVDRPNRHLWNILMASYPWDPCDDCMFTYMNGWFLWFACRQIWQSHGSSGIEGSDRDDDWQQPGFPLKISDGTVVGTRCWIWSNEPDNGNSNNLSRCIS